MKATSVRTSTPDRPPPQLSYSRCDRPLTYYETVLSGVNPPELGSFSMLEPVGRWSVTCGACREDNSPGTRRRSAMKESAPLRAVRARLEANENALRALRAEREVIQRELDAELLREQDRFAQAVMAKRALGTTLADIAHAMDCSAGTVSRAIARWRHTNSLPQRVRRTGR